MKITYAEQRSGPILKFVNCVYDERETHSIYQIIQFFTWSTQLWYASWRLLVVPRCWLSTTTWSAFSVVGPSVWNSLPGY